VLDGEVGLDLVEQLLVERVDVAEGHGAILRVAARRPSPGAA